MRWRRQQDSALRDRIVREAADWHVRLLDPNLSDDINAEFQQWLALSPTHVAEFLAFANLSKQFARVHHPTLVVEELIKAAAVDPGPSNVVPLQAYAPLVSRKRAPRWHLLTIVGAVLASGGFIGISGWLAFDIWLNPAHVKTAIGEQRNVELADGTLLQLNTNSEVRIDLQDRRRDVKLLRGEARFTVARDPARPFIVTTPQANVRALGTIFNVQTSAGMTDVAVLEGHVKVSTRAVAPPERVLQRGQHAAVTQLGHILPDTGRPIDWARGWPNRRLLVREEALKTVIAEINRYNTRQIVIRDPAVGEKRLSGTFAANDVESVILYLARYRNIHVLKTKDRIYLQLNPGSD